MRTLAGKVSLVGAGPGEPGLLTMKGRRCLQEADVIVYDRLVAPRLLALAKPEAELIYVGKQAKHHTLTQGDINQLLVDLARQNKQVVRLKGGDPFVFGRGGEEGLALTMAGVPWEVVPGITSSIAVPAYAGIPVTHRNLSPSLTVVTGHRSEEDISSTNWSAVAQAEGTTVILMGVSQLQHIVAELATYGKPLDTPVAIVQNGSRASQQAIVGTLGNICTIAAAQGVGAPACIVVGSVVSVRDALDWATRRPLHGKKTVVCAQTREASAAKAEDFEALGAETVTLVMEDIYQVNQYRLAAAVQQIHAATGSAVSGLQFKTAVGVQFFFRAWQDAGLDIRRLWSVRIGASGAVTHEALRAFGIIPDETSNLATVAATVVTETDWITPSGSISKAFQAASGWLMEGYDFVWCDSPESEAVFKRALTQLGIPEARQAQAI